MSKQGQPLERPKTFLRQPLQLSEYCTNSRMRHRVKHAIAQKINKDAARVLGAAAECSAACCLPLQDVMLPNLRQLCAMLDKEHASLSFWEQQLKSVSGTDAGAEDRTCAICLEEDCPLDSLGILPCAHIFHVECLREALRANPACPHCRRAASLREVSSLQLQLHPPEDEEDNVVGDQRAQQEFSAAQLVHGTKLAAVARRLACIQRDDPQAKALVFVQWQSLEGKVARALQDHGVPVLRLPRGRLAGQFLSDFQAGRSSDFALVLSLEHCAAGANLTIASHVIFVHPMNAATVDMAVAWEKQALGRVRRAGQSRSEVQVYRFVTRDTVEEHITLLHRQHA